jgi:hypothetical protein
MSQTTHDRRSMYDYLVAGAVDTPLITLENVHGGAPPHWDGSSSSAAQCALPQVEPLRYHRCGLSCWLRRVRRGRDDRKAFFSGDEIGEYSAGGMSYERRTFCGFWRMQKCVRRQNCKKVAITENGVVTPWLEKFEVRSHFASLVEGKEGTVEVTFG